MVDERNPTPALTSGHWGFFTLQRLVVGEKSWAHDAELKESQESNIKVFGGNFYSWEKHTQSAKTQRRKNQREIMNTDEKEMDTNLIFMSLFQHLEQKPQGFKELWAETMTEEHISLTLLESKLSPNFPHAFVSSQFFTKTSLKLLFTVLSEFYAHCVLYNRKP